VSDIGYFPKGFNATMASPLTIGKRIAEGRAASQNTVLRAICLVRPRPSGA
jgi:hypothetical protein